MMLQSNPSENPWIKAERATIRRYGILTIIGAVLCVGGLVSATLLDQQSIHLSRQSMRVSVEAYNYPDATGTARVLKGGQTYLIVGGSMYFDARIFVEIRGPSGSIVPLDVYSGIKVRGGQILGSVLIPTDGTYRILARSSEWLVVSCYLIHGSMEPVTVWMTISFWISGLGGFAGLVCMIQWLRKRHR